MEALNYSCIVTLGSFIDLFWISAIQKNVYKILNSLWLISKGESCAYVDTFTLLLPWLCSFPPYSRKNHLRIPVTRLVQFIVLHHFLSPHWYKCTSYYCILGWIKIYRIFHSLYFILIIWTMDYVRCIGVKYKLEPAGYNKLASVEITPW